MNPFFFGASQSPLFGAYHPSVESSSSSALLCYPIGHEYTRCHWSMRLLAGRLVQSGLHVLRFDYTGTGDSGGQPSVAQWRRDIVTAASELRDTSGARSLVVIGARFGATMAALEARALRAERLVLWDPVASGRTYLAELREMHQRTIVDPNRFAQPRQTSRDELLGYRWSRQLTDEIREVELGASPVPGTIEIVSSRGESAQDLADELARQGSLCRLRKVGESCEWRSVAQLEEQLLAPGILELADKIASRPSVDLHNDASSGAKM